MEGSEELELIEEIELLEDISEEALEELTDNAGTVTGEG